MTYKKMYEEDKEYQALVADYFNGVDVIKRALQTHATTAEVAQHVGKKLYTDLQNNLKQYNESKTTALKSKMAELEAEHKQELDYTSDQAKNLQFQYKLMSESELKDKAQFISGARRRELLEESGVRENTEGSATKNLLELNLLRLELRERGLEQEEQGVKNYIMESKLESAHENDERYQKAVEEFSTLNTVRDRGIIALGEFHLVENLSKELQQTIDKEAKEAESKKPTDIRALASRLPEISKAENDLHSLL